MQSIKSNFITALCSPGISLNQPLQNADIKYNGNRSETKPADSHRKVLMLIRHLSDEKFLTIRSVWRLFFFLSLYRVLFFSFHCFKIISIPPRRVRRILLHGRYAVIQTPTKTFFLFLSFSLSLSLPLYQYFIYV